MGSLFVPIVSKLHNFVINNQTSQVGILIHNVKTVRRKSNINQRFNI